MTAIWLEYALINVSTLWVKQPALSR